MFVWQVNGGWLMRWMAVFLIVVATFLAGCVKQVCYGTLSAPMAKSARRMAVCDAAVHQR
jgi:uncharacterized membrane protein